MVPVLPEKLESNKNLVSNLPYIGYLFPFEIMSTDPDFTFGCLDEINSITVSPDWKETPKKVSYGKMYTMWGIQDKYIVWGKLRVSAPNLFAYFRTKGIKDGDLFIITQNIPGSVEKTGLITEVAHKRKLRNK